MQVSFTDLRTEHLAFRGRLLKAWEETLDSASFIGGSAVEAFEASFAKFCEVKHAIGVGNGTDALTLALKAFEIGGGHEVILPANSFVATAEAVVHAGATPVFADVNPATYNIDVQSIEKCITPRTKAIIAVHLYGQPAEMYPILALANSCNLRLIEDSAQAHGARYHGRRAGSMGDAACFSFYPAKNLGACGDAGAVVTNDAAIANSVRRLRDHGGVRKYQHDVVGFNSRLDSIQAAALCLKLPHLDERNAMRRRNAAFYNGLLAEVEGIVTPVELPGVESVYHLYVVCIEKGSRNSTQAYLSENGVQSGIHYPVPIHRTSAFAHFERAACPIAEMQAGKILSLPMYPEISRDQLQYVAELISKYASLHARREESPASAQARLSV